VSLRIGSSAAVPFGDISTITSGAGTESVSFSGYYPGDYAIYATESAVAVHNTLTVGECP
jgi:hypothetical protein